MAPNTKNPAPGHGETADKKPSLEKPIAGGGTSKPPRKKTGKFLINVGLSVLLGALLVVMVVFYLISRVPEGYQATVVRDPIETILAAEDFLDKIGRVPYQLRKQQRLKVIFTEEQINAFLAYLENPELAAKARIQLRGLADKLVKHIPPKIKNLQVHLSTGSVRFDCLYDEPWLTRPVISTYLSLSVRDGFLGLSDVRMYAGRLPIKGIKVEPLLEKLLEMLRGSSDYSVVDFRSGPGRMELTIVRRKKT